ncbi:hypothetical protein [Phaeobacter gallaeciensis]|uniref:hypothetical protein n=1 Tax=Phaeobacter gallaeciensis TaxID=60890 RepID=UPI00237F8F58|nr:hypothetical protein [Phaeobacter gallaeciensis]MDE4098979.1 hypothetical protein [Phaeobacter gallaeciensis]MDE4107789.1 hypothetical protein [Phaeobacter gallaeciensis]MDE4112243.1 hypothetical protein [Phaeobacter gallaeciensis]MDE4116715.1 hypothetical protein [Phaeobacter gallaeciensis]MDE4121185.1 hypothetical protein [Phaeobacter gallaeciensis]
MSWLKVGGGPRASVSALQITQNPAHSGWLQGIGASRAVLRIGFGLAQAFDFIDLLAGLVGCAELVEPPACEHENEHQKEDEARPLHG